jgi:hypothetical protein
MALKEVTFVFENTCVVCGKKTEGNLLMTSKERMPMVFCGDHIVSLEAIGAGGRVLRWTLQRPPLVQLNRSESDE